MPFDNFYKNNFTPNYFIRGEINIMPILKI